MTSTPEQIVAAVDPQQVRTARALFREYAASIESFAGPSLASQGFEEELAGLPGKYAPPRGTILLAMLGGKAVGCAALRPIGARAPDGLAPDPEPLCEMKRLYVRPTSRGLGIGARLCRRLIADAKGIGYAMMKLDTEPRLPEALALYGRLGFRPIPRYNADPDPTTIYLGLTLGAAATCGKASPP